MVNLLVNLQYSRRSHATCLLVGSLKRRNTASVLTHNTTSIMIGTFSVSTCNNCPFWRLCFQQVQAQVIIIGTNWRLFLDKLSFVCVLHYPLSHRNTNFTIERGRALFVEWTILVSIISPESSIISPRADYETHNQP